LAACTPAIAPIVLVIVSVTYVLPVLFSAISVSAYMATIPTAPLIIRRSVLELWRCDVSGCA